MSNTKMTNQDLSKTIYRNLFTEDEWSAIESAMRDYADYGDEESDIAESIQTKLNALFN